MLIFTKRLMLRLPTRAEANAILDDAESMTALQSARADMVRLVRLSRQEEAEQN